MRLEELLRGVEDHGAAGGGGVELRGLAYDSRRVGEGYGFVAIRGERTDGNLYVNEAIRRGAVAVVSENPAPPGLAPAVAWRQVKSARRALAVAAARWFGDPAKRMRLAGITGTNGKTTTSLLLEALLRDQGERTGLLGTIEYHIGGEVLPAPHTTPESYELQALFARMAAAACTTAVMEVSSHALAMDRVWGCHFHVACFTNLTQDHLDYHGTMAAYWAAKRRLFEGTGAPAPDHAVVNVDDDAGRELLSVYRGDALGYGTGEGAALRATQIEVAPAGTSFQLRGPGGWRARVGLPLLGRVHVLNSLAALGAGLRLGLDREAMVATLGRFASVRGRFERVFAGQPFTVAVDYAHTPDALANLIALAREMLGDRGRLLLVFGCGGDRDRGKRPAMGALAAQRADWVQVTSDNPRGEDPLAIINDILVGAQRSPRARLGSEPDRRRAIANALAEARPGDLVAIAGKGHEVEQIVGGQRLPFDDAAVAREILAELGWARSS